jgi:hypothetical protein
LFKLKDEVDDNTGTADQADTLTVNVVVIESISAFIIISIIDTVFCFDEGKK